MLFAGFGKINACLVKSFCSQGKSAPVNSHRLTTPHLLVYNDCFFRINVLSLEYISGLISSDWQNSKVKGTKHFSNLFENRTVSGVSWVKYPLVERSLYDKASPKPSVVVIYSSFGPMTDGHESHSVGSSIDAHSSTLHPIHQQRVTFRSKNVMSSDACDKERIVKFLKSPQSSLIKMVIVVVTYKYSIDSWEFRDRAGRRSEPFWSDQLTWRSPIWEDWIDDEVVRTNLNDCSWVSDPSVSNVPFRFDLKVWFKHRKLFLKFLFVFFLRFSDGVRMFFEIFSHLRQKSADSCHHIFGDHCISKLIKPQIKLFFKHTSFDSDRRPEVLVLRVIFFRKILFNFIKDGLFSLWLIHWFKKL